ncbi:MAG TPA: SHOCT domain-containing protein [bacterium]|nr:SHOCT domain-containing protein [bacterium]
MGFGWIVPLVVIGLAVWAVIVISRSRGGGGGGGGSSDPALDILKERYAKGELDDETFQRMRKELEQ